MKQLMKYILRLLVVGVLLMASGCSSDTSTPEPTVESISWEDFEMSEQQTDFYNAVSFQIEEVNTDSKTAVVAVTLPDLEKYLKDGEAFDGSTDTVEIEFPVLQTEGKWEITSMDPLTEYIRNESNRIIYEAIEDEGGIIIDYDLQEVSEE